MVRKTYIKKEVIIREETFICKFNYQIPAVNKTIMEANEGYTKQLETHPILLAHNHVKTPSAVHLPPGC